MCRAYGAPPDLTRALVSLARQTRAQGWWHSCTQTAPGGFSIYLALEDAACALTGYAPGQVPPLLRTEPYARTLITSTGPGSADADRLVHECLARASC